jgi:phosphoserine aminotransferase
MVHRVHNFNAGPAAFPLAALERAQRELLDFEGTGMSVLEHSHRGKAYEAVHEEAIRLLADLVNLPQSHQIFFLQGGASQVFGTLPLNYLEAGRSADYVLTGVWGEKALEEARLVGQARVAASTRGEGGYRRVPTDVELDLDPRAVYVHYTTNETIDGVQFHRVPGPSHLAPDAPARAPLVADMSSDILAGPLDVAAHDFIYAGAQKNIGPAGLVVVIARKSFVEQGRKDIPKILQYRTHATNNSLYNTIPTFGVYLIRNVLLWLTEKGGLAAQAAENEKKAALVYAAIDQRPEFYRAPVEPASRSRMNLVFRLPTAELETRFVGEAERANLIGLKGHRSVGGIRVSAYNAVDIASIEALVSFMDDFARRAAG